MKKVLLLIVAALLLIGCHKDPGDVPVQPKQTPEPAFTQLSADSYMVFNGASVTVTFAANNATGFEMDGKTVTSPLTISNITSKETITIVAKGNGGSTSKSITVDCWSPRMTYLCNDGAWHITKIGTCSCNTDSSVIPGTWLYDDDVVRCSDFTTMHPDGSITTVDGSCSAKPGTTSTTGPAFWHFTTDEKQYFDGLEYWTIDGDSGINKDQWVMFIIKPAVNDPAVLFETKVWLGH